ATVRARVACRGRAFGQRAGRPRRLPGAQHEPAPGRPPVRGSGDHATRGQHRVLPPLGPARPRGIHPAPVDRPIGLEERNNSAMAIKVATDSTFETEVLHNDKPVVVDFWAAWCGPCKLVAPEMEKLAAKYEGAIDIVKVDVDANPGLSRAFNIMSIPTIAFFAPGKQPMGVVGVRPA